MEPINLYLWLTTKKASSTRTATSFGPYTRASREKTKIDRTATMDPSLALSLLSSSNAAPAYDQPNNTQPATNLHPTTTPHTAMDMDLARSLFQDNNNTTAPNPPTPKPNQPPKPIQAPKQPTNPPPTPNNIIPPTFRPPPPRFPLPFPVSTPFTPCSPSSRQRQKLLKKLYPTPGLQSRDLTDTFIHPAGYVAFDLRRNPRGLPYPWCELCRGDCWCVGRSTVWRMPEGGGVGECCVVM